ncbi:hypothetical protein [Novosphingobium sp. FSW06-99]|uniref:hypothetical protein n=1 Tax=Novosphingobium sp. FSW06-99 TaxID=1739113 RepID=UPI00076CB70C|nr:hypothetical protein [Novosphingobium sp. FSW06-99]KUR73853.1 hypothetical protein AQZ49_19835 [Novosphingobium sp. FSW06-99]
MRHDGQNPFPVDQVFSRQQLREQTAIPDDVVGFWIKEELLIPLPAAPREHRRFSYEQLNVAVILNAMRSLGANIGVLRAFAQGLQHGIRIMRQRNIAYNDVIDIEDLHKLLFRRTKDVEIPVFDQHGKFIEYNLTYYEDEIIDYWRKFNQIAHDERKDFLIKIAKSLNVYDMRWLYICSDLFNPNILDFERSDESFWLAWLNEDGEADIEPTYEGSSVTRYPDSAAFYVPFVKLIRGLWPDRIVELEEPKPDAVLCDAKVGDVS